ncbi:hypothetical protein TRVA0_053S00540 [Trichomonascus vanleenenianus]|uniref:E3 ubiquitin-protein ligase HRD1 n=1 Tax=Trichomonascus vanleenenianus TaxID=2268995 RepID=UPI003ECBA2DA
MTMRFLAYAGISAVLSTLVIAFALIERPNFYSACVAIAQSNARILVLLNTMAIAAFSLGRFLQVLCFGDLRALEMEHLYERVWITLTETFLALAMFREDFTFEFIIYFALLLFMKVFHWILADRVDLMFTTIPPPGRLAIARISAVIIGMLWTDVMLVFQRVTQVLDEGPSVMMIFGFEFMLLLIACSQAAAKFIINYMEARYLAQNEDEDTWERKESLVFFTDTLADVQRIVVYTVFLIVLIKPYGLPLYMLSDLYLSVKVFVTRINDYRRYLKANSLLDELLSPASDEDLKAADSVCIVCREDMIYDESQEKKYVPMRLNCGHILHYKCLRSWLARAQQCPICRRPLIPDKPTAIATTSQPTANPPNPARNAGNRPPNEPYHVINNPMLNRDANDDTNNNNGDNSIYRPEDQGNAEGVVRTNYNAAEQQGARQHSPPSSPTNNYFSPPPAPMDGVERVPLGVDPSIVVLPENVVIPHNWTVLKARTSPGSNRPSEVMVQKDEWVPVTANEDTS